MIRWEIISKKIIRHLIVNSGNIKNAKVLILGTTFKENVSDIRNSKVADMVKSLQSYYIKVHVSDPYASSEEVMHEYGYELTDKIDDDYDAVIVAVAHEPYCSYGQDYFETISLKNAL